MSDATPRLELLTRIEQLAVPVPPLSQSRFEKMACPYLYREQYILGHEEPGNIYALRGTQIHEAIAAYIQHLVETRQPSDYTFFDTLLLNGYTAEAHEILEGLKGSLIIDPEQVLAVEEYLALNEDLSAYVLEHTELSMADERAEFPPAFEGTPDLILLTDATTAEIWDWKSYFQIIDADTFQSKFYPLLVFQHYPSVETVRFHLQFVRYGATRSVEFTRTADLADLQKLALRERQRQVKLHELTDDTPEPMPGPHCCWCPLLTECPIVEMNPYAEMTVEARVKFAQWLAAAKKQNDLVLKAQINLNGPVEVADDNGNRYRAEFRLQQRGSYPLSCYQAIAANDPGLLPKLTIGGLSTPLKAKKRAALRELLDAEKTTTTLTKFTISGCDEEEE